MSRGQQSAVRLFRELFAGHPAHVAMLDTEGVILAVNYAWTQFGRANGLADDYRFEKTDYLDVCQQATAERSPYAQEAMLGLLGVLKAGRSDYSLVYPCHSPTEPRWFRMWVQTQEPEVPAVVVAHTYLGRERTSQKGRSHQKSRTTLPAPGQTAAPPRVLGADEGTRGGAALCPGVEIESLKTLRAGHASKRDQPAQHAIAYPWLYIGFDGAAAGVAPPASR